MADAQLYKKKHGSSLRTDFHQFLSEQRCSLPVRLERVVLCPRLRVHFSSRSPSKRNPIKLCRRIQLTFARAAMFSESGLIPAHVLHAELSCNETSITGSATYGMALIAVFLGSCQHFCMHSLLNPYSMAAAIGSAIPVLVCLLAALILVNASVPRDIRSCASLSRSAFLIYLSPKKKKNSFWSNR